jgi:tRNA (cytidine/uridine-2'-O-)-methyltransferase
MSVHGSLAALEAMLPLERTWLYTTRAKRSYRAPRYVPGSVLVFGRESTGLPAEFVMRHEERQLRIPMKGAIRSLNLSNSVAVALYGVLDQWGWDGE